MYCPECGVEYRPGFTECSDCRVALIHDKPRRTRDRVTVFEGQDPVATAWARNLLTDVGVPVHLWEQDDDETWFEESGNEDVELTGDCVRLLEVPLDCEAEARAVLEAADTNIAAGDSGESSGPGPNPDLELVTVFEGRDPLIIAAAKSALEQEGIPFYDDGEELAVRMIPTSPSADPWHRIQVGADREVQARQLLEPFESGEFDATGPTAGTESFS